MERALALPMALQLKLSVLLTVCLTVRVSYVKSSSYCNNYTALSDETRSIGYRDGTYIGCDRDIKVGWYRFMGKAGATLLDYDPGPHWHANRCQTHAAGWLNGQHPSVSEGEVTRKVCFAWRYRGNCTWSVDIRMKNCGTYYIYRLVPIHHGCYLRYCGSGRNCK